MNKENQINVQTPLIASLPSAAEQYTAPQIEVIDIEISQNILAGSPGGDEPIIPF